MHPYTMRTMTMTWTKARWLHYVQARLYLDLTGALAGLDAMGISGLRGLGGIMAGFTHRLKNYSIPQARGSGIINESVGSPAGAVCRKFLGSSAPEDTLAWLTFKQILLLKRT
ncbi:hypothetical protein PGT21_025466 [Puccinia graminis f. sp. tritici]|uniref:Uncharacterized protein n=1 Tax=Puccinia graminis f. sp. tritici TaxID=56615 RepID=A0A5B0N4M8_PUCGR|nr:hypothetical protein PGT21_025466 [Puccinia graminis f. sp. tritici]